MKKIEYLAPEMEVVKLNSQFALLAGSINDDDEGGPSSGGDFAPELDPEEVIFNDF
jgi:hypothetical protein